VNQRQRGRQAEAQAAPESDARAPETTLLTWTSSLRSRRPKTFAVGILATLLILALVWIAFPSQPGFLLIALVMMGGALGPLYFPVRFRLTNKRVYQRIFFSEDGHRWRDFDEYRVFDDGVFLRLRPTDLRNRYLKGLTLYFSPANRDEVLGLVRRYLGQEKAGDRDEAGPPSKN
jgi:hypothetical protein